VTAQTLQKEGNDGEKVTMPSKRETYLKRLAAITFISIVLLISVIPVVQATYGSVSNETTWINNDETTASKKNISPASIAALRAPPEEEKVLVVKATLLGASWDVNINDLRSLFVNGVKSYYLEVSYNQVLMNATVMNSNYTMPETEAQYSVDPSGSESLVQDALDRAKNDVNASGGFQIFKHIIIVHSGTDQAATHNPEDLTSQFIYRPGGSPLFQIGGVQIKNACVVSENDPLGVVVHELGHSQGLPDLYNKATESTGDTFVGEWDLMAVGSWNPGGQGTSPSHPSTWCKNSLGWIKPTQIININQTSIASGYNATILLNPQEIQNPILTVKILLNNGTYYLVEDRLKTGYDSALPGNGVLVFFCNNSKDSGKGPARLMSAHPPSLGADAAYNVGYFTQPFYGDKLANIGVKVLNKFSNGTFKIFIGKYNSALNAQTEYQDTTIPLVALVGGIAVLVVVAVVIYLKKGRQKTDASVYESVPVIKLS
jgi:M6 family metalloprotease-like protein